MNVVVDPTFSERVRQWASARGVDLAEAFRVQGRLLSAELISRTPPFSGRAIVRMLSARDGAKLRDGAIQDMTARQIGVRRVEKDIGKVVFGANGDASKESNIDFGSLQKCEGRKAVRVFATKAGEVYGVDEARFSPNASDAELHSIHQAARTKNGRVTTAGTKDRRIGRWVWLNVLVTKKSTQRAYIKSRQYYVGAARGGWANAFMKLGGKMSRNGWVGKHADTTGACNADIRPYNVSIEIINRSAWARGGDPDRIMQKSMAGRGKAIVKDMERILKEKWDTARRLGRV